MSEARDPFADIEPPFLLDAARTVAAGFRNEFGDAVDRAEATAVSAELARRVARAFADDPRPSAPDARISSALGRYLLQQLSETAFLRLALEPAQRDQALDWALAFHAVRRELEPDWADFFTSRLSGPGGLDLVVEVAHDLRSPLTSVLFLAETLQRGHSGPVTDIQRRQLGLIYSAALGLSAVTSDIIELARGGDRLVDTDPSPFSVVEILESVRDIVQPIAEEKGLDVRITPPPSDQRLGHPLAVSRVLLNLTTNALKFTDEGHVEIAAVAAGPGVIDFAVIDTGRGISTEALETLYQPFRRLVSRESGYCFSGTGLGLAICRRLVEAMGSALDVDTAPGSGTRFSFRLTLPPASEI